MSKVDEAVGLLSEYQVEGPTLDRARTPRWAQRIMRNLRKRAMKVEFDPKIDSVRAQLKSEERSQEIDDMLSDEGFDVSSYQPKGTEEHWLEITPGEDLEGMEAYESHSHIKEESANVPQWAKTAMGSIGTKADSGRYDANDDVVLFEFGTVGSMLEAKDILERDGYDVIIMKREGKDMLEIFPGVEMERGLKEQKESKDEKILLIDGSSGMYLPQEFAKKYGKEWSIPEEDLKTLLAGPQEPEDAEWGTDSLEDYWEVWNDILNNAETTINGKKYILVQDEDLWAVPKNRWSDEDENMYNYLSRKKSKLKESAERKLLVSDAQGIYVPQTFIEQNLEDWSIHPSDVEILKAGPDHPDYWEAWEAVLDYAKATFDGEDYVLEQDGDLWAVPLSSYSEDDEYFGEGCKKKKKDDEDDDELEESYDDEDEPMNDFDKLEQNKDRDPEYDKFTDELEEE